MSLGSLERAFINRYQGGFPLAGRPFARAAAEIGVTETELISSIQRLLDAGVLTRFGPLFDAARLGGGLTLAALRAPEERFDAIAEVVNALPAVAHNYRRDHELNMWFVVATGTPEAVEETLGEIRDRTGLPVYDFPKQREFYVGLWLRLHDDGGVETVPVPESVVSQAQPLDDLDRRIIEETQVGLPLTEEPCETIAAAIGAEAWQVLERLRRMLDTGVIRRVGAVPNHYRLGLRGNGMTVWDIADDRVEALGQRIGAQDFVSHCYQRPRHPGIWPYNLFAMVHGRDREEVNTKVESMAALLGRDSRRHAVLFSSAVLKKTGLRLAA